MTTANKDVEVATQKQQSSQPIASVKYTANQSFTPPPKVEQQQPAQNNTANSNSNAHVDDGVHYFIGVCP